MRKGLVMMLTGLLGAVVPPASAEPYLYRGGEPKGRLYLPVSASNSPVRLAEQELQEHLEAMAGKRMETVFRRAESGEGGLELCIRPESEWRGREGAQDFTIEEDAAAGRVRIAGNTGMAALYGAYQYLEGLGVRWFTPGAIGVNIPRRPDIPIGASTNRFSPSFSTRTFALSSTAANHFGGSTNRAADVRDYTLYLLRNRSQLGRNITRGFGFGECTLGSSHAVKPMTGLTTTEVRNGLMDREPERFALVTGSDFVQKRRYDDGQVCLSNEKNIQTAVSNAVAFFREKERADSGRNTDLDDDLTVPLGLSDVSGICECPSCKAIAGAEPNSKDRLAWWFWNRVARDLNRQLPGRKIGIHSPYLDLTQPPPDVTIEPTLVAVTPLVIGWEKGNDATYPFPGNFVQWVTRTREAGAALGCYNYLNFPWSPSSLLLLDGALKYKQMGYRHYHLEAMQRTEYGWPLVWALAQYTWDSRREPRDYLDEFCRSYYGEAGGRAARDILEDMTVRAKEMDRINFGGAADAAQMFPGTDIAKGRERLASALGKTAGREQERLRRFADSIEAQFQMAETYRAYAHALNERTPGAVDAFTNRANSLMAFWKEKNLDAITTLDRTPAVACRLFLKTAFGELAPAARKELAGKGPGDERWMKELYAGSPVPASVPNLYPLPEVWKFHLDDGDRKAVEGFEKPGYDDRQGWPPVSTWSYPSGQGYHSQIGGHFWYRLVFRAPVFPVGKRVFLRIGSLDDAGDIFLNGVKVGSQPEARNWDRSFALDVTGVFRPGEDNLLAVHGYDSGGAEGVWRPSALYTD